jgi:hypothetical protein
LAFAGIGPRSAGAGGALGVTIGAVMAVASWTPAGIEVVRFASGRLHAVNATDTPATASTVNAFMETPDRSARCERHRRMPVERDRCAAGLKLLTT